MQSPPPTLRPDHKFLTAIWKRGHPDSQIQVAKPIIYILVYIIYIMRSSVWRDGIVPFSQYLRWRLFDSQFHTAPDSRLIFWTAACSQVFKSFYNHWIFFAWVFFVKSLATNNLSSWIPELVSECVSQHASKPSKMTHDNLLLIRPANCYTNFKFTHHELLASFIFNRFRKKMARDFLQTKKPQPASCDFP